MTRTGLYIQMFSVHGLVRPRNIEMGRDADTGGQVKYVIELAEALGRQEGVDQVDLFTRWIQDKRVSPEYGREIEEIGPRARLVRIRCGGGRYHRKELLWPYLDEYADRVVAFTRKEGRFPDLLHGHYADGGYVAMTLASLLGVPYVFTGHSLGRVKKQKLIDDGMTEEEINRHYFIDHRIAMEERAVAGAALIVTSTSQEVSGQYRLYQNRHSADYQVIPPGVDLERFYPYYDDRLRRESRRAEREIQAQAAILEELNRFFMNPEKPVVLSLCRPDKRKNIGGLIKAFGEDRDLQAMANLAVFAGIRKDISQMGDNEKEVLTEMLLLMDKYDLYGAMAIPKTHDPTVDVPALYRTVASSHGVFVNSALTEPFGLTLIEAAACGLPVVATNDGGPVDIVDNCKNGILVDVTEEGSMARAARMIIADREKWKSFSAAGINGVRRRYTWEAHCERYLEAVQRILGAGAAAASQRPIREQATGKRLARLVELIVADVDDTLTGDEEELRRLSELLEEHRDRACFCVATGRTLESTIELFADLQVPFPDIIISSVGAEINYSRRLLEDKGWSSHISQGWQRDKVAALLAQLGFLEIQEPENQRTHKISYYMKPHPDRLPAIYALLEQNRLRATLVYSHQSYLDVLPPRASKGKAVKYLAGKWNFAARNILVCGDSGNDEEMLRGPWRGVVVGNYRTELEKLKGRKEIYFSRFKHAAGIIDGIRHYRFLEADGARGDTRHEAGRESAAGAGRPPG